MTSLYKVEKEFCFAK